MEIVLSSLNFLPWMKEEEKEEEEDDEEIE
jgi:hypothetical protein